MMYDATPEVMTTTADLLFTDAVQDLAARDVIPLATARSLLIGSGAYDALYDFETGLWSQGPDYILAFHDALVARAVDGGSCASV